MSHEISPSEIRVLEEAQQFLQSAVHDLRAHQRRSGTAAQLLLETSSDQERAELCKQMTEGLSKTEELLGAISRYSVCLNPVRYSIKHFHAATAVRFALANLDREIKETGAIIALDDLPEVSADRDRLTEVFEHLLSNALKFHGSEPPKVHIGARRAPEGWLFSVTDHGEGIPAQYRDRLFIPFRRLHGPAVPGVGLGLAASRKIVEAHGGRIWIDTKEASGTTFCFTLPAADGD